MWWWVPPRSSSWLCGPPCRHCGVGACHGCLPLILEAMGAPALVIVVVWCLPSSRRGCAPCHCCGYGCPRSSSWLCGAPLVVLVVMWCLLVIIMAIPGCPCGRVVLQPSSSPWVPPWLSLWPCGAARSSSWSCGLPPVIVMAVWCLVAIGALPHSSSSLWVPSRPWVSPRSSPGALLGRWCSPVIVVAMLWPCGAPPGRCHGRPRSSSAVPPRVSLWSCGAPAIAVGAPLVILVAVWCPLVLVVVWTPPGRCRGHVVPPGHSCPCALPRSSSSPWVPLRPWVSPFIPWCPAWPLVLPGHCGGCVVAMWCPPTRPHHRECPPPGHPGCAAALLLIIVAMWCTPGCCRGVGALPCLSSRAWVHMCVVSALLLNPHPSVVVVVVVLWW